MVADVVVFADAEQVLGQWLQQQLGIPVGTRVPNPRPARFLRVFRSGGVSVTVVTDGAILVVESWDRSEEAAWTTASMARGLLLALPRRGIVIDGVVIQGAVDNSGPQNLPDPRMPEMYRYTFTIEMHLRGASSAA